MGLFSFLHDDAIKSFLRLLAFILLPFLVALSGLVFLNSIPTALLWLAMIAAIVYGYVRFNAKHNEHGEFDDHLSQEKYDEGLRNYLNLTQKQQVPGEDPAGNSSNAEQDSGKDK